MGAYLLTQLLVACGDEDIDRRYTDYRTDIVTFMGNNASGAQFQLLGRDDTDSTLLQSTVTLVNQYKHGQRVLLRYDYAGDATTSRRAIAAYGVAAIISDTLRYTVQPLSHYLEQMEPVKLASIWRTRDYINLRCQAEYTGKPRQFYLLLDSTTWHNDTVHCYLVNNTLGDTTYHWREAYASFYVGGIWNRPSCRAMSVHISDASRRPSTYHFLKQ